MVIYSHSKLSTFEQCSLKFKFQYIDKLVPEIEHTIESFLGSCVHDTLEWLYNSPNRSTLELDDILKKYAEIWNANYKPEIRIIKKENSKEFYQDKGVKALIDYFMANKPFEENTIATEKRIFINLDDLGKYRIQGYIDRLVNEGEGVYSVHDYKTGALKTQRDLDKDRQLALYALGIYSEYPDAKDVRLTWHFLAFNKKLDSKRTINELEQLKLEIIELINKIESAKEFSPNPSLLCKWCAFRKYCPLFNGHKSSGNKSLLTFS